jgi:histidinol-phosphate phosphatase family protein
MSYGVLGPLAVPLALGTLTLSTEGRPEESAAIEVIRHAWDAGIRVFDTADSYALDDKDLHYGERLLARALAGREATVVTKVGMARPKGRWVPAGAPDRIRKRVEASLKALGVDQIFLLLLHVNDPAVPFEAQLGALADLQRQGKVRHLGLANVGVAEIRQAERHFEVAALQVELSVVDRSAATEGTLELARRRGIPLLAHRPFGGHAKAAGLEKNRAMKPIADRYGVSRHQAALATLLDLGAPVVPLFGTRSPAHVDAALAAVSIRLDADDRAAVAAKIRFAPDDEALLRLADDPPPPPALPAESPSAAAEVVIAMGVQGAGKSSTVGRYEAAGYTRLNRDLAGGSLDDLLPDLRAALAGPNPRVILDNTYPTRVSRWPVVRAAHAAGVPVRCIFLDTPLADAHRNIAGRMLERYDRLLGPDEMKALAKSDPNLPPPQALVRWSQSFEKPSLDEGFGAVQVVPFVRHPSTGTRPALLLDVDGTVRRTLSGEPYPVDPADIELLPGRREVLQRWIDDGYTLFFVSNQSGVASGKVTEEAVLRCFAHTVSLLGLPIADVAFCPHPAFPAGCFCRKPMPGLGVQLARRHDLDLTRTIMVGDLGTDRGFAEALGVEFRSAAEFFGD